MKTPHWVRSVRPSKSRDASTTLTSRPTIDAILAKIDRASSATDEQAKAEFWPAWRDTIALVAEERGFAIPTEASFDWETGPHGALYVGSPETVARKIATNLRALGATRFDLKYGLPGLTHDQLMTNVELYGQQVVPRVRELLG